MNLIALIQKINGLGISISVEQGELSIIAAKGVLTESLLKEIRTFKAELTAMFSVSIPVAAERASYPLTSSQNRFWFLSKFEGANAAYNINAVFQVNGAFNIPKFEKALEKSIFRHESLRTIFKENDHGEPEQFIIPFQDIDFRLRVIYPGVQDTAGLSKIIETETGTAFNLETAPLLSAAAIVVSENQHLLLCTIHHIIGDGLSINILMKEVMLNYQHLLNDTVYESPALPIQYKDYTLWLEKELKNGSFKTQENYWLNKFNGEVPVLDLPSPKIRPVSKTYNGESVYHLFPASLSDQLISFSAQRGLTVFMTLMAGINGLFCRYTAQEDIVIGIPIAGRDHPFLEDQVGLYINTLAIRTKFKKENTFEELVAIEKTSLSEAYSNQNYPFNQLIDQLKLKRDTGRSPLFDIMAGLLNEQAPAEDSNPDHLQIEPYRNFNLKTSQFDLNFFFIQNEQGLELRLDYNTDIYDSEYIGRLIGHFEKFISEAVHFPLVKINRIDYLAETEKKQLLDGFNHTQTDYPEDESIASLFDKQAADTPVAAAIVFEDQSLTYDEIRIRSNQFASFLLAEYAIESQDLVGLSLEKSEWIIPILLGILKTGAAYVPIDPNYPKERQEYFKSFTNCRVVIDETVLELFTDRLSSIETTLHKIPVKADDLAHIMFTSGSTGTPKGVMISHRNIIALIKPASYLKLDTNTVWLSTVSISFDTTNLEFWGVLLNGGKLVLAKKEDLLNNMFLKRIILQNDVNSMWLTSSWFEQVAEEDITVFSTLSQFVTGGDIVSAKHINLLKARFPHLNIINGYGPTEDTTFSTIYHIETIIEQAVPIGKPIDNGKIYILNDDLYPQPTGISGTLYTAGAGVARGYYKNQELTNEKFIDNPFVKGEKMYNTGDSASWLSDGNIRFIGRIDRQEKIRGKIIDITEIENKLLKQDMISQCVVLIKTVNGEKRIIAYVVVNGKWDIAVVKEYLKTVLPVHMIPNAFIEIPYIPLSPNGKADRNLLPSIAEAGIKEQAENVQPSNALEEEILAIWQKLLKQDAISIHDDFFDIGGHSLMATRVISAVRAKLGLELSISDLFLNPTIYELALVLKTNTPSTVIPELLVADRPQKVPLSFSQERLWFIDKFSGSVNYHIPFVVRLTGTLDTDLLEDSFRRIITRHEVLRTIFKEDNGVPYQETLTPEKWNFKFTPKVNDRDEIQQLIDQDVCLPFDLEKDFMLRVHLIRTAATEYVLIIVLHHIASDGWSMPILVNELIKFYQSAGTASSGLPALPVQYADYAIWQRSYMNGEMLNEKADYWVNQLKDLTEINLRTDFKRPLQQSTRGAHVDYGIDLQLTHHLQELSRQENVTLFMTLLAVFKILLYKYTGERDIAVGTPVANRGQQETESLIGFFVNTLVLRSNLNDKQSFSSLLSQVKETTLAAYSNQDIPFEKLVDRLVKNRDLGRNSLYQILFTLQNNEEIQTTDLADGLKMDNMPFSAETSKLDLSFSIAETADGLKIRITYCTDLFLAGTIERLALHFNTLLSAIARDKTLEIGKLTLLSDQESAAQKICQPNTSLHYPADHSLIELFEQQAAKTPLQTALVFEGKKWTYDELNKVSNQLAAFFNRRGIKEKSLVGIYLETPSDAVISILAVLKSGAAYVPIDSNFPKDRINFILKETAVSLLVSQSNLNVQLDIDPEIVFLMDREMEEVVKCENNDNIFADRDHEAESYVIYTSGSTGRPKGVVVNNKNLLDYFYGLFETVDFTSSHSFALMSSLSADLGNTVLFGSLLSGGLLHLFSMDTLRDARKLHEYFKEFAIDCFKIVPAHWKALSDPEPLLPLKTIIFGGEELSADILKLIGSRRTDLQVINHYGPTETTIGKLIFKVDLNTSYERVPLGKTFSNTNVYILDSSGLACPAGVPGELCVSGDGVAAGYINGDLTSQKFVNDPFVNGLIMYRTGDLVYSLPDGNIVYLGRIDTQIKIRGFRVEPQEIENVLRELPVVKESIVVANLNNNNEQELAAYIVPDGPFDNDFILSYLKSKLPDYMVPALLIEIAAVPLNSNGKVDRKALPQIERINHTGRVIQLPQTPTEIKLAAIWTELLHPEKLSVHDNFFQLGGHSLLAIRVVSLIRSEMQVEISIRDLFIHADILSLAIYIDQMVPAAILPAVLPALRPIHIPLSFAQQKFWFIDQLQGSINYHIPMAFTLKGNLNFVALNKAIKTIIDRHEVLHTVIRETAGIPYQHILSENNWKLNYIKAGKNQSAEIPVLLQEEIRRPFDLSADYLIRGTVINLNEQENILVLVMHHIVSDGWARTVFIKELTEIYQSVIFQRKPGLTDLTIQYADYAIWQKQYFTDEILNEKAAYWIGQLKGVQHIDLPFDYARPAVQSFKGSFREYSLSKELSGRLNELSGKEGVTLFMTLITAFKVLLYRYSGQEDICLGTTSANRTQKELEVMMGVFINTLAIRSNLSGNPVFTQLLSEVKETTLQAFSRQDVPFDYIVDKVLTTRDMSRNPIFDVLFTLHNFPENKTADLSEVVLTPFVFENYSSQFDLNFNITETPEGLTFGMEYCSDLFSAETIHLLLVHYERLLFSICDHADQHIDALEMITEEETELVLGRRVTKDGMLFNAGANDSSNDLPINLRFEEIVRQNEKAIAIIHQAEKWEYQKVNHYSNQIANTLKELGIQPGEYVGVYLDRSPIMICCLMGILKAGAVYVPVDSQNPLPRIEKMIRNNNMSALISNTTLAQNLTEAVCSNIILTDECSAEIISASADRGIRIIDGTVISSQGTDNLPNQNQMKSWAYVLYTSGSTGEPKGAITRHDGAVNHILAEYELMDLHNNLNFLQSAGIGSDISVWQMLGPLLIGGTVTIIDKVQLLDYEYLYTVLKEECISLVEFVPAYCWGLIDYLKRTSTIPQLDHLEWIMLTGEAVPVGLVNELTVLFPKTRIVNCYGPCEASDDVIQYEVNGLLPKEQLHVPVGRPIANMNVLILDNYGNLCPIGVPGHLYVSGVGVGAGYLNMPEKTASSFIVNPFTDILGDTMYKTGDMAKWLSDGNVVFLGRSDNQVKIRGHRVELGEIESFIRQHQLVEDCHVMIHRDQDQQELLIAFVVTDNPATIQDELHAACSGALPLFMQPSDYRIVKEIPRNISDKVDERALTDIFISQEKSGLVTETPDHAPRNVVEEKLVVIWQEVLKKENVGIYDNFFEIGGHSLLVTKVILSIRGEFSLNLPIITLFKYATIADLSNYMQAIQPLEEQKEQDYISMDL